SSEIATTLVMARPVSQPSVDVAIVKRQKRCRLLRTASPATYCRPASPPFSRNAPTPNGQSHMFNKNPKAYAENAPYAASRMISARPRHGGSSAAPRPTQAEPSIWNGNHGPTPPVSSADVNIVVAPSTKPKPGP